MQAKKVLSTLEYTCQQPYTPRGLGIGKFSLHIMSTTVQSPVQDITAAEAEAKRRTDETKQLAQKEVEAFRVSESDRRDARKTALKKEASDELKKEKEGLGKILKQGKDALKKEQENLHETVKKNEDGIVSELVEQFLSLK